MMRVGVPKEIKNHEYRVGLTPSSVRELTNMGVDINVQQSAGEGSFYSDAAYQAAGATILGTAEDIFAQSDLIVKVKEPQPEERRLLQKNQTLFTYLHLAPDPEQARDLIDSGATCIAYETVIDKFGGLPLLAPMSEIAGCMSTQVGASNLERSKGGRGVLLGGSTGVAPANVMIVGGGIAGTNAARIAVGMGADVTIFEKSLPRMRALIDIFGSRVKTQFSTIDAIEDSLKQADLVIGAVLVPGDKAPKIVTKDMLALMKPGAVIVDIAIDQGGCFETSRPTSHQQPTYEIDGIIHYCVTNMPGGAPQTATAALNAATFPYVSALATKGVSKSLDTIEGLREGLNVHAGKIVHPVVASSLGFSH